MYYVGTVFIPRVCLRCLVLLEPVEDRWGWEGLTKAPPPLPDLLRACISSVRALLVSTWSEEGEEEPADANTDCDFTSRRFRFRSETELSGWKVIFLAFLMSSGCSSTRGTDMEAFSWKALSFSAFSFSLPFSPYAKGQ